MENDFIDRSIKTSMICAGLMACIMSLYMYLEDGLSLLAGASWGCINLVFTKHLFQQLLSKSSRNYKKIIQHLGLKFPVLYSFGYLLLMSEYFQIEGLIAGISLIFLILMFQGLRLNFVNTLTLFFFMLFCAGNLGASLESEVPEVPNIFSLLYKRNQGSPWFKFLHHWESIIFSIAIAITLSLLFHFGARNSNMIPSKFQNFLEWIVESLRNFILEILGPEGEKFVPFLGTLFIYILTMNWMVLIPFMKAPSSNFNITVALAICVFVLVQYLNIKNFGVRGFLYHLAGSPKDLLGWALVPLMFVIELLTQFSRPITLALRLFGNVVGEDILIGAFALFGVVLLTNDAPIGLPMQIPFMFLSLLTGLMQALVFTLLSTIYILLSTPSKEH